MKFENICLKLNEYEKVRAELYQLHSEIYNELMCNSIKIEDLDVLEYNTLKLLMPWLKLKFGEVTERGKKLMTYFEKRKVQEYPGLNDVKYFPELKDIEDLTQDEKICIDNYLRTYILYTHIYPNTIRGRFDSRKFMTSEIFEKLCQVGVLEKVFVYGVSCDCKEDKEVFYLSQKEYVELQEFFNNSTEIMEEELNKLLDRISSENEAYCYTCDNIFRIKQKEDLDKYEKVIYRIIKQADLSWDSL